MKKNNKQYSSLLNISASIAAIALFGLPAYAQEQESAEDESWLEEVIVTGTRITRRDYTSPSPLTTISREDIEFSGQPNLEAYLNQMPQVQPGYDRTANNPGNGTAEINLRGLGSDRTLVLMNGRRLAPSGVGSSVDANNLPTALVDRVEIITGGASTVYGSDAVAGVVNFITRDDFDGFSIDGSYNVSESGDANIWDVNVVYGHEFSNGRGNITAYAGVYEREALFASDREFTSIPYSDNWITGEIDQAGSSRTPDGVVFGPFADLGNGPVRVTFDENGNPREFIRPDDLWNYAPVNYLQLPLTRFTGGLMGHFDFSDRFQGYFEATYAKNEIKRNLAPAPLGNFLVTNVDNPLWSPQARSVLEQWQIEPGLAGMFFARRMLELGNRIFDTEREYTRLLGGVRGEIASGWNIDAWITHTRSDEIESILNNGSVSRIQQALLVNPATGQCFDTSGGCAPADVFGANRLSAEAVDFIRWQPLNNLTKREQNLASVVVTGAPFDLWSGPVDMAFGAEWREDTVDFEADPILFSGDVIAIGGDAPINGTESVFELYTEAIFTLFESKQSSQKLDVELGARWSDYDNAGSVTTWKAGLDWQITDSIRFRTMAQHAVRAPNNADLFSQQFTIDGALVTDNFEDPCSASADPVGKGNVERCLLQGIPENQIGVFQATPFYPVQFILGGNPNLVPEDSDTFTAGFVFTPAAIPELVLAIDYYDLEVTDSIGFANSGEICFDENNTDGLFCDGVTRDTSLNISEVLELTQNRGLLATDGIDVQAQYQFDLPSAVSLFGDYSQMSINMIWTHTLSRKDQENAVTKVVECVGLFGWPCREDVNPENRLNTTFSYSSGPFSARLAWRWIDSMDNAAPLGSGDFGFPDPNLAIPSISSWNYFDLGLSYQFGESTNVKFGINNLADEDPAFMANATNSNNTSPSTYDVFGRSYYLKMDYRFSAR